VSCHSPFNVRKSSAKREKTADSPAQRLSFSPCVKCNSDDESLKKSKRKDKAGTHLKDERPMPADIADHRYAESIPRIALFSKKTL
jgi:hypothetical protein